jgi:hypothetical protein
MNSALDQNIVVTLFEDVHATSKQSLFITLRQFSDLLLNTRAPTKFDLPLFCCSSFDNKRSAKKALRRDDNVRETFCLVGDHDDGTVSLADAADAVQQAGIAALLVTTPSYTNAKPRWRIIAPLSDPLHHARTNGAGLGLADYPMLISRLAGIFPTDTLAPESWVLSQSWFMGSIAGALDHGVLLIEEAAS